MKNLGNVNRQYIGARYVPKFFNNNGSAEWVQGVSYEPLTIVTYLHNSYTSTTYVPNNVGSPNVNGEYWVLTGDYNYKLNEMNNQLNTFGNELNSIDVSKLEYYPSLAQAYASTEIGDFFMVGGKNVEGDYGTAIYGLGDGNYQVTINGKLYHLIYNKKPNVAYVNHSNIGLAINYVLNNNEIPYIPKGTYNSATTIVTKDNAILDFNGSTVTTSVLFMQINSNNVSVKNLTLNGTDTLTAFNCFKEDAIFENINLSNLATGFGGQYCNIRNVDFDDVIAPINSSIKCVANSCIFSKCGTCMTGVYENCKFTSGTGTILFNTGFNRNLTLINCDFSKLSYTAIMNLANQSAHLTLINNTFDVLSTIITNFSTICALNNDKLAFKTSAENQLFTGNIFISDGVKKAHFTGFAFNGATIDGAHTITNGVLKLSSANSFTVDLSGASGAIIKAKTSGTGSLLLNGNRLPSGTMISTNTELAFTVNGSVDVSEFEIVVYN